MACSVFLIPWSITKDGFDVVDDEVENDDADDTDIDSVNPCCTPGVS